MSGSELSGGSPGWAWALLAAAPVGCARGMPTFQNTSETSSFYFSHLSSPRAAGSTYWEPRARARWGCACCVRFRGTGLDVLSCAEYEGDGQPHASTSCKTREHGRYGSTDVCGRAEGDRSGGCPQLLWPVNPVFIGALWEQRWEQTHTSSLSGDESSVPCSSGSGVTGPC